MDERHFGMTGSPFQLSPDTFYYFEGKAHQQALTELRGSLGAGAPLIVLSGEIGSGKTTILRTLSEECVAAGMAVGQLTNTQLDADQLLMGVATAFGLGANGATRPAELKAALLEFLAELAKAGRRALLIIDEAQNLGTDGFALLADLLRITSREPAVFQVCLAGQPELRERFRGDAVAPGSRVHVLPHLAPLEPSETRAYIEHRLRKAGWKGLSAFEPAACDEIHRWTGGVPRRINVLCNRLMVAHFADGRLQTGAAAVAAIAGALCDEIAGISRPEEVAHVPQQIDAVLDCGVTTTGPDIRAPFTMRSAPATHAPLLCVASGRSDHIKAASLLHAIGQREDLPPARLVSCARSVIDLNHDLYSFLGLGGGHVDIQRAYASWDRDTAEVAGRFAKLIGHSAPCAVIVLDATPIAMACAVASHAHGVPVVHVGSDAQGADESLDKHTLRVSIGELAQLRFGSCSTIGSRSRVPTQVHEVGNLLVDSIRAATRLEALSRERVEERPADRVECGDVGRYGVVALRSPADDAQAQHLCEAVQVLREVSRDLPLVWPVQVETVRCMQRIGLTRLLAGERIACVPEQAYARFIGLMVDAACVLTDSWSVEEEAAALGVPCVTLGRRHVLHARNGGWLPGLEAGTNPFRATRAVWQILFNGEAPVGLPELWDGHAAVRVAWALAEWLHMDRDDHENVAIYPTAHKLGLNP